MKLKFVDQQYQTDAVNAICNIFQGSEIKTLYLQLMYLMIKILTI